MSATTLDGPTLRTMLISGAALVEARKRELDNLNVFPVPDGDTGTNMSLTAAAAVREVQNTGDSLSQVASALANGSLMGARGNSGVILSQLFRGMADVLQKTERASPLDLAQALQAASEMAYRGVMKPREGTMLTVSKDTARAALRAARNGADIEGVLAQAVQEAEASVTRTPQLLDVLREAGVVDAGGMGVLFLLQGALDGFRGEPVGVREVEMAGEPRGELGSTSQVEVETELLFQYCTEFIVKGLQMKVEEVRRQLQPLGDSLLAVGTETMVKVHLHTNHPGQALETGVQFGSLHDVKIDNMAEQHRPMREEPSSSAVMDVVAGGLLESSSMPAVPDVSSETGTSVIAVAAGEGFAAILKSLGVEQVIGGGETMNPSTEELVQSIKQAQAERVLVLPNNKNVFLAARQAGALVDKAVGVVPSRSVVQGIAALLAFSPDQEIETNHRVMEEALQQVITGEVTYAARDSNLNGHDIEAGDIIGLVNGRLVVTGDNLNRVIIHMLEQMVNGDSELITIYFGRDVPPPEAERVSKQAAGAYPELEIELHYGGQPLYYYVVAVE